MQWHAVGVLSGSSAQAFAAQDFSPCGMRAEYFVPHLLHHNHAGEVIQVQQLER